MVRENRIKTYTFNRTISATSTETITGDYPINGEILQVEWKYGVGAGSIGLSFSGNGLEFFLGMWQVVQQLHNLRTLVF